MLETGQLAITLSQASVAEGLGVATECVNVDDLQFNVPFAIRRRGVETRLLLKGQSLPRDETQIGNIARVQAFLGEVTGGRSFQEIAENHGLSVKRVQQILEYAFLSPFTVRQVIEGRQPPFLTTDWCLKNEIPADWRAQDVLFRTA